MKTKLYPSLLGTLLLWTPLALNAQTGALDPAFNGTGYLVDPVNQLDVCNKILVQPDQKVLNIGMSFDAGYVSRAQVFRYLPDGSRDPEFGTDGSFTYQLDFEANLYSAVLTPEGKIVLAGSTTDYQSYRILLIQLNADGSLDTDFGSGGVVAQSVSVVAENAEDMSYDVTLDALGNILVCGTSFNADYIRRPIVVRFFPDGALDTSFGLNGVASIPVLAGASGFEGVAVQADGRIVACGYFGNTELWYVLLLARFNDDGTLDPTFGDDGVVKLNYGNVDDEAQGLVITPDGSILTAGVTVTQSYNYSALLVKFTPDGALDLTFSADGVVVEDNAVFDYAAEVKLLNNGKIVMAGTSGVSPPSSAFDLAIWTYNADGTRDASFDTDGFVQHDIDPYATMIYGMDVQADGKIIVGGQARTASNQNYFFTARVLNDIASGVDEPAAASQAFVFPNPVTVRSTVTLQVVEPIQAAAQLSIHAADGRLLGTYTANQFQRTAQGISFQLPAALAPGIYQLAFQQQGTRVTSSLLVTE